MSEEKLPNRVDYGKYPRYDTTKPPKRQKWIYKILMTALSKILLHGIDYKIEKVNMEGLKPPYFVLSTHMYFVDFYFTQLVNRPYRVHSVATIDGYYRRPWVMEQLGCMCKRKFTTDPSLLYSLQKVLKEYKDVAAMYPEARYSPDGTTAILPETLAPLIKLLDVPVVVIKNRGNHLHTPFWNYRSPRKVPLRCVATQVLTQEDVRNFSHSEIMKKVLSAFSYDEYAYQRENHICIDASNRAEGLHKILYQCPHCLAESRMQSEGAKINCGACGKSWELDEYGQLHGGDGFTEFAYIPDWFRWEREQVRAQVEAGTYHFEDDVDVYSMPHPKEFLHLGQGHLTHSQDGFILTGEYHGKPYRIRRPVAGMDGLHVEYDYCYLRPEDCVDISTSDDSFYCYPKLQNVVTKLSFATEELYRQNREKRTAARMLHQTNATL